MQCIQIRVVSVPEGRDNRLEATRPQKQGATALTTRQQPAENRSLDARLRPHEQRTLKTPKISFVSSVLFILPNQQKQEHYPLYYPKIQQ